MALRVTKIADIVESELLPAAKRATDNLLRVLMNVPGAADPNTEIQWRIRVSIGEGAAAREITIDLPHLISRSDCIDQPLLLADGTIVYFRDQLYLAERRPKNAAEREEIVLRVKKAVYDGEAELASLRSAVANMEAAIEFEKLGPKRNAIPEDVKLLVWARDGGSCVRCGSKQNLHFDHLIPVAKGGGNSEANIQILCEGCNLKKGDKISF
jgi:hypothetical protein